MARFFIDRPIFAWVIALIIMLAGVLSIRTLPVSQYPSIAPPTVVISANYPGASAKIVEDSVTQVIEQRMKGIDHLRYIASTSDSFGNASITLTFNAEADPDIAQVQVQNKLQGALLWRLTQLMSQGWSMKDPAFGYFGRATSVLYQGLNAPTILLLGLPLLLPRLKQAAQLLRNGALWPYPTMGMLLTLLADKCRIRLGGPRYYQGTLQRWSILGSGDDPDGESPRKVLNILQGIGWGWLMLALLVTVAGLLHG